MRVQGAVAAAAAGVTPAEAKGEAGGVADCVGSGDANVEELRDTVGVV